MEVVIEVEGESYRARGAETLSTHEREVLDLASDARVILKINAGKVVKRKKTGEEAMKSTRNKKKVQKLTGEFMALKKKIEEDILPGIILPELRESTEKPH